MYGYVYLTENMVNGKRYIGQHRSTKFDTNYYGSGVAFYRAFKKYGKENFKVIILEWCDSKEELDAAEIRHIQKHNATESNEYYNISSGGHIGNSFAGKTEAEKQAIVNKWRNSMMNRTEEQKQASIEQARRTLASKTPEEVEELRQRRSLASKRVNAERSVEAERLRIKKIQNTRNQRTLEQKQETSRKHSENNVRMWESMTDEQFQQRMERFKKTRNTHSEEEFATISTNISEGTKRGLQSMSPEKVAAMKEKRKVTWQNKSPEERAKYSAVCSKKTGGKIWVNNMFEETLILPDQLPEFELSGFTKGRLKREK